MMLPISFLSCILLTSTLAFSPATFSKMRVCKRSGVGSLVNSMDLLSSLSVIASLRSAPVNPAFLSSSTSLPVAVTETRQGFYKEYTVDVRPEDKSIDDATSKYKTAEETDLSKNKYWIILGVLLFGSFAIPMVQYYWYVAEED